MFRETYKPKTEIKLFEDDNVQYSYVDNMLYIHTRSIKFPVNPDTFAYFASQSTIISKDNLQTVYTDTLQIILSKEQLSAISTMCSLIGLLEFTQKYYQQNPSETQFNLTDIQNYKITFENNLRFRYIKFGQLINGPAYTKVSDAVRILNHQKVKEKYLGVIDCKYYLPVQSSANPNIINIFVVSKSQYTEISAHI